MPAKTMMFKVQGAAQSSKLGGMAGKTYTVGKVSSAGNGLANWLFLSPTGGAGGSSMAVKIEGTRQVSQIAGLAGKTVTVGKSPTMLGGIGQWLVLSPAKGAAAAGAAGATGAGAAAKAATTTSFMMQVEGAAQATQLPALSGKTFTVMKPPMMGAPAQKWLFLQPTAGTSTGKGMVALKLQHGAAGQLSSLAGKTVTISKAPIAAAGAGKWIIMKPVGGAAAKAAAGIGAAGAGAALNAQPIAFTTAVPAAGAGAGAGAGTTQAAAGAANTAKAVGASGTIWKGTGLSLGLGLGLGAWGPALIAGAAIAGVGVYGYLKGKDANDGELEALIS
ncbi:MAG: hypothetical protein HQL52_11275 [Magnetococcales bacterium]|nr:hypothetical protein [Magnetococcales bacterium]